MHLRLEAPANIDGGVTVCRIELRGSDGRPHDPASLKFSDEGEKHPEFPRTSKIKAEIKGKSVPALNGAGPKLAGPSHRAIVHVRS